MPREPALRQRLDACCEKGSLSTADLAVWLDSAYATVRSYRNGVEPYPARRPQIEKRLQWLEKAVATSPRFPVPLYVRSSERKRYVSLVLRDFHR